MATTSASMCNLVKSVNPVRRKPLLLTAHDHPGQSNTEDPSVDSTLTRRPLSAQLTAHHLVPSPAPIAARTAKLTLPI